MTGSRSIYFVCVLAVAAISGCGPARFTKSGDVAGPAVTTNGGPEGGKTPGTEGTNSTPTPTPGGGGGTNPTPTPNPGGGGGTNPTPTTPPGGGGGGTTPTPTAPPGGGGGTTPTPTTPPSTTGSCQAQDAGPFETTTNTSLAISKSNVLTFVTTQSGRTVSFNGITQPTSGSVYEDGSNFRFTPGSNFLGTTTFRYKIIDSAGCKAEANVIVNVREAAAKGVIYLNSPMELFRIDGGLGSITRIANFTLNGQPLGLTDIAISREGAMYGVSHTHLYYINAATGEATIVKDFSKSSVRVGLVAGLTFLPDGRMVLGAEGLFYIDAATRNIVTPIPVPAFQTSGDVIALPDGFIYWIVLNPVPELDTIYRVNPATGQAVLLNRLPQRDVLGLVYYNSQLFAYDIKGNGFTVDASTGAAGPVTPLGAGSIYGATVSPVQ